MRGHEHSVTGTHVAFQERDPLSRLMSKPELGKTFLDRGTRMDAKATRANISDAERVASAVGGALLAAFGIAQRSKSGTILAAAGGALIVRGATGFCPGYAVAGIDRSEEHTSELQSHS